MPLLTAVAKPVINTRNDMSPVLVFPRVNEVPAGR